MYCMPCIRVAVRAYCGKKLNGYNIPKAPCQSSTDKLWCFHVPECVLIGERSTLLFPYWNCSCVKETEKHVVYIQ